MKTKIVSFLHKPKHVTTVSLIVAVLFGILGYVYLNKKNSGETIITSINNSVYSNSQSHNLSLGFLTGGRISSVKVKSGDVVVKGEELATLDSGNTSGALTQAKASYNQAKANYEKLIHGATSPAINVAKAAVNTAQINLSEGEKQQDIFVANAKRNLLNSTLVAEANTENLQTAPTVSGVYNGDKEGVITISTYGAGDGVRFNFGGIATGTGKVSQSEMQPIANTGLSIIFPSNNSNGAWSINIPNTKAANYLANYNAYQNALQTRTQTLALLQANLDQANASLEALVTAARPEDVAAAQAQVDAAYGAIEIAQAVYDNTVIKAPYNGVVVSVSISAGQIAVPNAAAIELEVK